jgi:small-conductance mechanosensitive channel
MAEAYPSETATLDGAATDPSDRSLGELIGEITSDLSTLMRKEIDLAKAEIREEAVKAGKAAGMLGGGAFLGYLCAVVLTFAAVFGLAHVIDIALAAVAVGVGLALIALVLVKTGQKKLRSVEPKPERTLETLKEDAQWARHPTS